MFSYNPLFPFFQPSITITPEVSDYWSPTVISLTWPPLIPSSPNPILIFLTAKWSNPVVPHCGILSPLQADLYVICVVAVPEVWLSDPSGADLTVAFSFFSFFFFSSLSFSFFSFPPLKLIFCLPPYRATFCLQH